MARLFECGVDFLTPNDYNFRFHVPKWWNWQTRHLEGVVERSVRVQIPPSAPLVKIRPPGILARRPFSFQGAWLHQSEWSFAESEMNRNREYDVGPCPANIRQYRSLTKGMKKQTAYPWEFKPRFRRNAFGWKSQPAILRVRQAVSEIRKVARRDPLLGAEGAVLFLTRVSPALEHVDSSSGAIGTAVNHAIEELAPIISAAPADAKTREDWLGRLWQAHVDDGIPYIELLTDH